MVDTKYFRFNAVVGNPDSFPIDETNPERLQELCNIVDRYMAEAEQQQKLKLLGEVVNSQQRLTRKIGG